MMAQKSTDSYLQQVQACHESLGIAADYATRCGLPLCREPEELAEAGLDILNRPQRLTPATLQSWQQMQAAAAETDVELQLVSAYRSVQYQHDLISKKLASGQTLAAILTVNAAPGFSEHHTGRAIDLCSPECPPLQEQFEHTSAFHWLSQHANRFNFHLSYPRHNKAGMIYEPWHWCYHAGTV